MRAPPTQLLRLLRTTEIFQSKYAAQQRSLIPTIASSLDVRKSYDPCPRRVHISSAAALHQPAPVGRSSKRGPISKEDTQTDFGSLNVLGNAPPPTTSIDACLTDGFHLDNGLKIGGGSGCLLIAGEAFSWRPWEAIGKGGGSDKGRMINTKGQWAVEKGAWGILDLVWPKPDLLILGLGASTYPISPETRKCINSLGIQVDIQDTRNAAAQFNLLATERGVSSVAAALIPIGWSRK